MSNRTYEIVEKIAVLSTTTRPEEKCGVCAGMAARMSFWIFGNGGRKSMDQKPQARASA